MSDCAGAPDPSADTTSTEVSKDPSNTDIDDLTAPLDPNDDVFSLVNAENPDTLTDAHGQ